MNTSGNPEGQMIVKVALENLPHSMKVFQSMRMNCVGCHLAGFCTLEDAARVYRLPLQGFLESLLDAVQLKPKEKP